MKNINPNLRSRKYIYTNYYRIQLKNKIMLAINVSPFQFFAHGILTNYTQWKIIVRTNCNHGNTSLNQIALEREKVYPYQNISFLFSCCSLLYVVINFRISLFLLLFFIIHVDLTEVIEKNTTLFVAGSFDKYLRKRKNVCTICNV